MHFTGSQLSGFWRDFFWEGVTAWRHMADPLGAIKLFADRIGWTVKSFLCGTTSAAFR